MSARGGVGIACVALLLAMCTPRAHAQSLSAPGADAAMYVVTYLEVRPETGERTLATLRQYRDSTRRESGNRDAQLLQEPARPNQFALLEAWPSAEAFAAHQTGEAALRLNHELAALQQSPADVRTLRALSVAGTLSNGTSVPSLLGSAPPAQRLWSVTHVDILGGHGLDPTTIFVSVANQSRGRNGNLRFDVLQGIPGNHITLIATWLDRAAFDAYAGSPAALQLRQTIAAHLGSPYDERLYQLVE